MEKLKFQFNGEKTIGSINWSLCILHKCRFSYIVHAMSHCRLWFIAEKIVQCQNTPSISIENGTMLRCKKKMEQNKNENSIPNIISLNYLSISDTKSITTTARGVFSTRLDIYKWYRHEFGAKGLSRMLASWHLFTFKSKFIEYVRCFRRRQSRMFTVNAKHFLRALFFEKKTTTKTRSVIAMHYDLFGFHAARPNSMQ